MQAGLSAALVRVGSCGIAVVAAECRLMSCGRGEREMLVVRMLQSMTLVYGNPQASRGKPRDCSGGQGSCKYWN